MKIVIVAFTYVPAANGVAHVASSHAEFFAALGHDVTVVTGALPRGAAEKEIAGVAVRRFDVSGSPLLTNFYRGDIRGYQEFLRSFEADIWFFHCWQIWSTDLLLSVRSEFPHGRRVLISHGSPVQRVDSFRDVVRKWLLMPYRIGVIPRLMRRFTDVVFLAEKRDRDRFYDALIYDRMLVKPRRFICGNGYTPVDRAPIPALVDALMGRPYICYVANLDPVKNHELFIRIFSEISKEQPLLQAILVGGAGDARLTDLKDLAEKHGVLDKINFVKDATVEQIAWIFNNADAQLFTSKSECLPLAVLECSAQGCPSVSLNVGAISTIPGAYCVSVESHLLSQLRSTIGIYRCRNSRIELMSSMHGYTWSSVLGRFADYFGL